MRKSNQNSFKKICAGILLFALMAANVFAVPALASSDSGGVPPANPPGSVINPNPQQEYPANNTDIMVTFETDGGSQVEPQALSLGGVATRPENPTKEGFVFDGWYYDRMCTKPFDFEAKIYTATTVYAKWTETAPVPLPPEPDEPTAPEIPEPPIVWDNIFDDISEDDWFYADVEYVVSQGIFNGITTTSFAPNAPVTRAMFVTALWRLAKNPEASTNAGFADVNGEYYAAAINWAAENGIVKGMSDTMFAPDAQITREQMAVILYNYQKLNGGIAASDADVEFADKDSISAYARESVITLVTQGIISGKPGNLFDPQGTATRAEVAAVLHRFATV